MESLLGALAVWRLTKLVTEDEITRPLREKVVLWSDKGEDDSFRDQLGYLVECRACVSIWASAAVVGLGMMGRPGRLLVQTLAGSAAALVLAGAVDKLEG